ncbi:oligosaccharyltransferase complex subunit epsilon [Pestalotiopsis sp. 9143b]|nr:oligosaccharyltransferase complex subunit epsilon [Pestalotiopsis sp. 9143b]
MAKKATAAASTATSNSNPSSGTTTPAPISAGAAPLAATPKKTTSSTSSSSSDVQWNQMAPDVWNYYQKNTPQRTKLIDAFMSFLVVVGAIQFLYCILAGNYPFNAFLSGFGATVGQFVLTASLRVQTTEANKSEFPAISPERAFADYIVGSLILHFFVINFIN